METLSELLEEYKITWRQYQVLKLIAFSDATTKGIAEKLNLAPITVHQHTAALRRRLKVHTNFGLILKAYHLGLIDLSESGFIAYKAFERRIQEKKLPIVGVVTLFEGPPLNRKENKQHESNT